MDFGISQKTINRLPLYLTYLKGLNPEKVPYISSTAIATDLKLNSIQVRKDLAVIAVGKPKVGFNTKQLINAINEFLGYNRIDNAIIIGAGKLGKALLSYSGFSQYGIEIVAAFDTNPNTSNSGVETKKILPLSKMADLVRRMQIKTALICVPASQAQDTTNRLVEAGIRAILNFAPVHLVVPEDIIVQNENLASELAMLTKKLQHLIETE